MTHGKVFWGAISVLVGIRNRASDALVRVCTLCIIPCSYLPHRCKWSGEPVW